MQSIIESQDVVSNNNYVSCESGEFDELDFVKCKLKTEIAENTVMFLAIQINNLYNESSS